MVVEGLVLAFLLVGMTLMSMEPRRRRNLFDDDAQRAKRRRW